jgi:lipopolysaccharide heptosyltransferase II
MEQHAIERYLCVTDALGCGREPVEFIFPPRDDADRQHVDSLIPPGRKFAVLMPGANWETKRWPLERFAALVAPLRERFGLESVVCGGPEVAEMASQIPGASDLSGRTTLRQMVEILERADLVVANDTGPMHIAAALGRPLVTPYGPTNPVRTGPYRREASVIRIDLPCSPCYSRRCSHQSCLQWLRIEPVLELAAEQLSPSPREG